MALKFQNLSKQIVWVPCGPLMGPAKASLRGKRQQRALLLLKMMSMVSMKMMSRGALARHPFWTAASCKGDLWPAPLPRYMVDHLQTPQWSRKAFHQPWTVPLIFFFKFLFGLTLSPTPSPKSSMPQPFPSLKLPLWWGPWPDNSASRHFYYVNLSGGLQSGFCCLDNFQTVPCMLMSYLCLWGSQNLICTGNSLPCQLSEWWFETMKKACECKI